MIDIRLGVIRHSLLEEVCLALQGYHVHEIEEICDVELLIVSERDEMSASNKFNVLTHQLVIHADQSDRESTWTIVSDRCLIKE